VIGKVLTVETVKTEEQMNYCASTVRTKSVNLNFSVVFLVERREVNKQYHQINTASNSTKLISRIRSQT